MKAKSVIRIQTRYQPDIHKLLAERAEKNNRSLNCELMEILKDALTGNTTQRMTYPNENAPTANG